MTAEKRHPLIPPRTVDPHRSLPAMEAEVLERWRAREVFAQSVRMRADGEPWIFYEGPPTANGRPGAHHVLSRVFKDIYPRYKTMRGHRVERKGGWDCHGLPVEIAVEQKLGINSKHEIENVIGIEEFNRQCRESVFEYLEEWNRLTERIGFWIDLDDAYRTLDEPYIESVWWALAEIHRRGLLYEGHKVVPYCPRCGTALSSHEVALGYQDVVDPSVYVRLPVQRPRDPLQAGDALLIWTTTPWTLPGNVAVAVGPDIEYVRARSGGETLILAASLVEKVLGEHVEILDRFPGRELVGATYEPPFVRGDRSPGDLNSPVIPGDFVTTEDGTGLVHIAPAFGEDDFEAAAAAQIDSFDPTNPHSLYNPVRPDGTYDQRVRGRDGRSYEGRFVKDPELTEELIEDLRSQGLLFRAAAYEHSYPHCWRCGTPLIYYAKASWYIRTTAVRERMLAGNETIAWHPPHIKHGRFGDWLQNNVDWALSRERYWGTPLPVWRCDAGHIHVIGSFTELEERSGGPLADHHRPYVDEVEFACTEAGCEQPMRRVPEVIDVWFDSGAMPFAQHHAPLEHRAHFEERFPADFICEALDQTRGWFYSLLAVSTLLFDTAPYRNVVCLGLILDGEGQKMSKSRGNTVEPWQVIDAYGADAFRWYFFTSKQPWDGYRFSEEAIGEGVRLFLKQLWSTYFFYVLYAHANEAALRELPAEPWAQEESLAQAAPNASARESNARREDGEADLDRWALSRTAATAQLVTERLDAYDATAAGRAIAELVDDLSNWYVRRSRRRFWDGDPGAFRTLRSCLLAIAKLLAPFCPFVADEIYDNLDGSLPSVHLCDFPTGGEDGTQSALPPRDPALEEAMAIARQTVRLGLGARGQAKIKIRQPLAEAVVVATGREREAIERLAEIVREELNVRAVRFVAGAEELGRYEAKANYRRLGPLFGPEMPLVAGAIAALDPALLAAAVRDGREIGISVVGREHTLAPEDVILTMQAPDGYTVEREGSHAVALELAIDEDLRREGRAREIVHAVQSARKNAGLAVENRIELRLAGDPALLQAAAAHRDYLAGETLAVELRIADGPSEDPPTAEMTYTEQTEIEGLEIEIALRRGEPLG
ncbi:MAG TPA: isoleucine--tRNA ligase [Solirubrobacteraceae bacterium]|jgi:isoleucyl-tRNA synthetase|nr:isoleucine--tRNA ligase [Solirubrobacteraceae bacterium]